MRQHVKTNGWYAEQSGQCIRNAGKRKNGNPSIAVFSLKLKGQAKQFFPYPDSKLRRADQF